MPACCFIAEVCVRLRHTNGSAVEGLALIEIVVLRFSAVAIIHLYLILIGCDGCIVTYCGINGKLVSFTVQECLILSAQKIVKEVTVDILNSFFIVKIEFAFGVSHSVGNDMLLS